MTSKKVSKNHLVETQAILVINHQAKAGVQNQLLLRSFLDARLRGHDVFSRFATPSHPEFAERIGCSQMRSQTYGSIALISSLEDTLP
jgi:hypothetical protein